ncbi:HdeD family acid-resistance protein [Leifsonia sp. NPDC058230]|uniref:HdeD family acid-resistance protein n=1 Tax=Leifsonia sp. NPDC058230 TaxID=3346391 RepID=UPI0036DEDBF9
MSNSQPSMFASFSLDAKDMTASVINTVRVSLGISGAVALIIGIIIVFWPKTAAAGLTILIAISLLVSGLSYLGIGIFAKGLSGGARALDIVFGVILVVAAILAFANLSGTTAFLAVFLGILVGIIWIVEGATTFAQLGDAPSRGWAIFFAILSIVAGIVLLFSPLWGFVVLFILLGISLIVLGIVQIIRAFTFGRGAGKAASATA